MTKIITWLMHESYLPRLFLGLADGEGVKKQKSLQRLKCCGGLLLLYTCLIVEPLWLSKKSLCCFW